MVVKNRLGRAKGNRVYFTHDVLALYKISANTLTAWRRLGLSRSDSKRPYAFRGAELNRFHAHMRKQRGALLHQGMFLCLGCKEPVNPMPTSLDFSNTSENGSCNVRALCGICGSAVRLQRNATQCDALRKYMESQFEQDWQDEVICGVPAEIGISEHCESPPYRNDNDRLLYEWHSTMSRLAENTIDAHLVAFREFESFVGEIRLEKVTTRQVADYVRDLSARLVADENSLSKSTIRHRASHLRGFYKWLCDHPKVAIADHRIPSYFDLPKRLASGTAISEGSVFPTRDEMSAMITSLPTTSLLEMRQKAIVVLSVLTAIRASALISLRIGSLDLEKIRVRQNVKDKVRTKNGKDMLTAFFPVFRELAPTFCEWIELLKKHGLQDDDALFPRDQDLKRMAQPRYKHNQTFEVMRTQHAVTAAYRAASQGIEKRFTPHTVRHLLVEERFNYCSNAKEAKAWSRILGHEDSKTTEEHYAQMGDHEAVEIVSGLEERRDQQTHDDDRIHIMYLSLQLDVGSPEWDRAVKLHEKRSGKR